MARHEVIIHENPGLSELAPYTGNYISKETLNVKAFAEAVGAKCGLPAIQVISILGGSFDAIEALEREGLVRVHTDIGVVCAVIKGSFPTADAAFDPERNSLELALRLDDAIRYDLADVVPTIVTDENITKLRVDNVMDLAEERPMNLIHGQHPFRVAGFNIVLTDVGATMHLENALGTKFQLVIDEIVSKQLVKAHTAELLPAGDYKLVVQSRAGDAGGPLQTSFRKVKYLRVVDPEPTRPTVDGFEGGTFHSGDGNVITGERMRFADDTPTSHIAVKDAEGQPVDVTFAPGADYDPAAIDTTIPLVVMSGDLVSGDEYTFELDMLDGDGAPCTASFTATYNAS